MKRLSIVTILLTIFWSFNSNAQSTEGKTKVLVVSFIEDNFYSDIYSKEEIAKTNDIEKEEVIHLYDAKVAQIFKDISNEEVSYIQCPTNMVDELRYQINFTKSQKRGMEIVTSDLSDISDTQFASFINTCNVDYVIFINAFRMSWVGDPQYKLDNGIHYSIYNQKKEEVTSDVAIFSTPKLIPITKMEKKCTKSVGKLSNLFARLD